jgi:4-amino-4-deoxy-L-arabinose transferase-like glycosyltransferase
VLRDFPNSADEYAYVVSAECFARGRLSVPSPEPARFFDYTHCVNDGRFYGKYPPGWPALLAVGVKAGAPWLVNPLIGAITLLALYALGCRLFPETRAADFALLGLLANPFFLFNSGSYFSHSACLLFLTTGLWAQVALLERPGSHGAAAGLSLSAALAFATRPYTALLFLAPCAAQFFWRTAREKRWKDLLRALPAHLAPAAGVFALFLLYNRELTGDPFLMPFAAYAPTDRPDLADTLRHLGERLRDHGVYRLIHLGYWLPLAPLFAVAFAWKSRRSDHLLLPATALAVFAGYLLYWGSGINQYGPRYLYELGAVFALMMGATLARMERGAWGMLAAVLLLNVVTLVRAVDHHGQEIEGRMALYRETRGLANAVVFLRSGSGTMPPGDLTRNGVTFDGPVLYVWDRGEDNSRLLADHPGRAAYVWERGRLRPWTP